MNTTVESIEAQVIRVLNEMVAEGAITMKTIDGEAYYTKNIDRSAIAKKAWATRKKNKEAARLSAIAKKAWATRKANKTTVAVQLEQPPFSKKTIKAMKKSLAEANQLFKEFKSKQCGVNSCKQKKCSKLKSVKVKKALNLV